jgi:hypothetical protein
MPRKHAHAHHVLMRGRYQKFNGIFLRLI